MNERERQEAERLRQAQEKERERRELLRRIGEGGPEQHVPGNILPGRVEAEAARAAAETQRRTMRHFYVKLAGLVALPVAFIALLPAIVGLYLVNDVAHSTRDTLCELRADVERRAENTQRFLDEHPGEFPLAGISRPELERSLELQRKTLASLSDLDCE